MKNEFVFPNYEIRDGITFRLERGYGFSVDKHFPGRQDMLVKIIMENPQWYQYIKNPTKKVTQAYQWGKL